MTDKALKAAFTEALAAWKKLTDPSASRGKTAYPKRPADQERLGIRFDYDKLVTREDGTEYHLFKLQPNAGKIPPSIMAWRDKHGTDAVMANVYVKKDGTMEDVQSALEDARQAFKNS